MILLGLGGNLLSKVGPPEHTIGAAIEELERAGAPITRRSRAYRTAPVPASDQPWFVNEVVAVTTKLLPRELLALAHRIEARFGRVRSEPNAARTLDIDILVYDDLVQPGDDSEPTLPHPRLARRAFVLLPLRDVAPGWRHPITGETVEHMIAGLPPDQVADPILD